jgi:diaminohydroxyphosphoribosylaminopyrimidine deaminase/5-amino-6-(5-phosphoribosylamino)uracil reductase
MTLQLGSTDLSPDASLAGGRGQYDAMRHMRRALDLAALGRATTHPNPRVGCVIVRNGEVVGEGWHQRAGEPHAEVHALRQAGDRARGADVYVTLEPCAHHGRTPPCADALIAAGVGRVFAAMMDPDPRVAGRGLARLREAGVQVESGLCEADAQALNRGFVSRLTRGRPWVTLKLAMSLDGRTAMADGESQWITGAAARDDVHRLRAEAGAVLTTAETVLADDPQLTVRLPGDWRQPDRIVLDSRLRVPATAKVWNEGARRIRLTSPEAAANPVRHSREGTSQFRGPVHAPSEEIETITIASTADSGLALDAAIAALAARNINEVFVECGPRLAGALLEAKLVDELLIYAAPMLLGHQSRPLALLPGIEHLADRIALRFTSIEMIGDDIKIIATPHHVGAH